MYETDEDVHEQKVIHTVTNYVLLMKILYKLYEYKYFYFM